MIMNSCTQRNVDNGDKVDNFRFGDKVIQNNPQLLKIKSTDLETKAQTFQGYQVGKLSRSSGQINQYCDKHIPDRQSAATMLTYQQTLLLWSTIY